MSESLPDRTKRGGQIGREQAASERVYLENHAARREAASKSGQPDNLTTKERRVIDALQREGGPITAYYLYDYAGVVRTDIVCGNLIKKGLVRYGEWVEGNCEVEGYEVHLTEAGESA